MIPVLALGAVITASPVAMIGVLGLILLAGVTGRLPAGVRVLTGVLALAAVVFVIESGLFRTIVLDKFSLLFSGGVTDTSNVSLVQRINETYHAWRMFLAHPWGVGMGNYGYFFGDYPDLFTWITADFTSSRRIPNNIYLEVLCEHGAVGFALFVGILGAMGWPLLRRRFWIPAAGFLLLIVYFLAFPTFRISFIWVFWGWIVWLGRYDAA